MRSDATRRYRHRRFVTSLLWLSDPAGSSSGMESVAMIRQAQGDLLRADVDALDTVEDVDLCCFLIDTVSHYAKQAI